MTSISGINLVQGSNASNQIGRPDAGKELTDAQKAKIKDILSNYDSTNITETSAKEIFQKFADAGIQPSRGMKEAIDAAGFDAEKLRDLGMPAEFKVRDGRHGRRHQETSLTDAQKTTVTDILSKYDPTNLSTSDASSILQAFRDASIRPSKDLAATIDSAGFSSDLILKIPNSKGSESNFWASQNAIQNINLSSLQSLQSILNQYDLSNISPDQQTSLIQQLQSSNIFSGSNLNLSA